MKIVKLLSNNSSQFIDRFMSKSDCLQAATNLMCAVSAPNIAPSVSAAHLQTNGIGRAIQRQNQRGGQQTRFTSAVDLQATLNKMCQDLQPPYPATYPQVHLMHSGAERLARQKPGLFKLCVYNQTTLHTGINGI